MAKRKKVNKRVVVPLVLLGVTILAIITATVLPKMFPKDPELYAARARKAAEKGNYSESIKQWVEALDADPKPQYRYELAELQFQIIKEQPNLPGVELAQKARIAEYQLQLAVLADPTFEKAQRKITEISWSRTRGVYWKPFIEQADKLLATATDDHETYIKRAYAKSKLAEQSPATYKQSAIDDFRKAIELKPDESSYWQELVNFYNRIDDRDPIEPLLLEALEKNPDSVMLRVIYSSYLIDVGRAEDAQAQIEDAIAKNPDSVDGYLAKANFHMQLKDYEAALGALQSAREIDKGQIEVYKVMSIIYRQTQRQEQAFEVVRDGLESISELIKTALEEGISNERRTELELSESGLHYLLADMLLDQALSEADQREALLAEARQSLELIEKRQPDGPQAAKIGGRIAIFEGNTALATELLEKADAGFKGQDLQTARYLIILYSERMPGKAEKIVDRYLGSPEFDRSPSLLLAKARLEMQYREYDKASLRVARVLEIAPDDPQAQKLAAELAVLRGGEGQLPEDLNLSNALVRQRMLSHAVSLWAQDQKGQAVGLMAELHRRRPEDIRFISELHKMYLLIGEDERASNMLEKAIALQPDNIKLKRFKTMTEEKDPQKRIELWLEMADAVEDPVRRALERAAVYANARMPNEYLQELQKAEKIAPEDKGVIGALFTYAVNRQQWELAEDMAGRAAKINADGAEGAFYAANLAVAKKEFDKAIKLLAEIATKYPDSKMAKAKLGYVYLQADKPLEAEEIYSELVRDDPSYTEAIIGMVKATHSLGKKAEHMRWVDKAYKLAPENSYIQRLYLENLQVNADPEEVIPKRLEILKSNPDDIRNRYMLGYLYTKANQHTKAEEMFRSVWDHPRADKMLAARLLLEYYAQEGRYAEGYDILNELLAVAEDKVGAYLLYGRFASAYDETLAKNAFQKAIDADPNDERGYRSLAGFYANRQQWDQAIETIEKCHIALGEGKPFEKDLIKFMIEADRHDQVDTLLQAAMAENPDDAELLVLKGALAGKKNQYDQAEQWLTRAMEIDPSSHAALVARAGVRRNKGDYAAARADLEAARLISDNADISMQLAQIMTRMGDIGDAQIIYADIMQKYPDDTAAIMRVLELYLAEKQWSLMVPLLEKAKERSPKVIEYKIYEARMELVRGNREKALSVLAAAVAQDVYNEMAARLYLETLVDARQYQKAVVIAKRYSTEGQFAPLAKAIHARILVIQNQLDEGEKLFAEAINEAQGQILPSVVQQLSKAYGYEATLEKLETVAQSVRKDDWLIRMLIGEYQVANKDLDKAISSYVKARELTSDPRQKAAVNRSLGIAQQALGRSSEAEKAYLAALEVLTDDFAILNNLAYMYTEDMDQPAKALPFAKRVAMARPGDGNVLDTYGWSLAKAGKLREAEQQLNRAVAISPALAAARYHLGWVFEKKGRFNQAEEEYRSGYELLKIADDDPLKQTLADALERIRKKLTGEE